MLFVPIHCFIFILGPRGGDINAIELCCIVSLRKTTEKLPDGKLENQIGEQTDKWTKEEQMLEFM